MKYRDLSGFWKWKLDVEVSCQFMLCTQHDGSEMEEPNAVARDNTAWLSKPGTIVVLLGPWGNQDGEGSASV